MMVYGSRNLNVSISELQLKQVSHKALTELGADLIVALHGDTPPTTSCLADAKSKHNTGIFKLTRFPVTVQAKHKGAAFGKSALDVFNAWNIEVN